MLGSVEKDKSKEYVGFKELLHTKIGFPSEEAELKQPFSSQGIWPHSKKTVMLVSAKVAFFLLPKQSSFLSSE